MRLVFADTGYWIALLHPEDDLHGKANSVSKTLARSRIVTTDFVLSETLAFFAKFGLAVRQAAAALADGIHNDPNIDLVPARRDLFLAGLRLYRERLDKNWSHVDCTSFHVMKNQAITEALAHDKHFQEAGFRALLRED